jgi:curli production assembly/transport component CsgE
MKRLYAILFFLIFTLTGAAQTDTLMQSVVQPDTLLKDTTQLKEAPESLQKLIGEMKAQTEKVSKDADIELDGMLFDNTKTKSGKDFFDFFYSRWKAPPEARNYSIYIIENPFRLMITQIEVKINETTVFRSFLQPRADIVEQLAEQAVAQTRIYLANYEELIRRLESEDRAGTGIF